MSDPCSQHHRIGTIEKNMDGLMEKLSSMESKFDGKLDLILMQINQTRRMAFGPADTEARVRLGVTF